MHLRPQYSLEQATLQASTPDQLLNYVHAVSGAQSHILGNYMWHLQGEHAILVGYNLEEPQNTTSLDAAVQHICSLEHIQHITVLAPIRPLCAPDTTHSTNDAYYFLDIPFSAQHQHNVRGMIQRAHQHIYITQHNEEETSTLSANIPTGWTSAHQELMLQYINRSDVSKEMGAIFQRLGMYCRQAPQVKIFSAYDKETHALLGCTVGDFSSLQTAFYMFAFRSPTAPPGVAEALLYALLQEAQERGYSSCNLGLGIHDGIRFFKEKWGAKPSLPLVQTSWSLTPLVASSINSSSNAASGNPSKVKHWLQRLFS